MAVDVSSLLTATDGGNRAENPEFAEAAGYSVSGLADIVAASMPNMTDTIASIGLASGGLADIVAASMPNMTELLAYVSSLEVAGDRLEVSLASGELGTLESTERASDQDVAVRWALAGILATAFLGVMATEWMKDPDRFADALLGVTVVQLTWLLFWLAAPRRP